MKQIWHNRRWHKYIGEEKVYLSPEEVSAKYAVQTDVIRVDVIAGRAMPVCMFKDDFFYYPNDLYILTGYHAFWLSSMKKTLLNNNYFIRIYGEQEFAELINYTTKVADD